jgi:glutamate-ammonia-ligase adenylyltransferase
MTATPGQADGRGRSPTTSTFGRAVKGIYSLIGDTTEHGFVFRVDLALRPNGNSGAPAVSLASLEEYLQIQGREWERFAWLKSRIAAPLADIQTPNVQALRGVVLPFVFRRYLDYSVFDSLRSLHRQIREHAPSAAQAIPSAPTTSSSRAAASARSNSSCSCCRWCAAASSRAAPPPTLEALQRLVQANLMSAEIADALSRAYIFLRQVEHRIQYLDDQQTHVLPTRDDDLLWIARTLGYADACGFLHQLDEHRELVAQEFDTLLGGDSQQCSNGHCNAAKAAAGGPPTPRDIEDLIEALPPSLAGQVADWRSNTRINGLRDEARARLFRLVERTAQWVESGQSSEEAAKRFLQWLEPLLRRESYLALLLERPAVHESLLHLLGAARWPARYLQQHPGVIDELASDAMLKSALSQQTSSTSWPCAGRPAIHGRGRRRNPAQSAAPRPPCRGLPHPGARYRRPHHRRAGGRRPQRPGRQRAAHHGPMVLEPAQEPPPRYAALRHRGLRQAGRQGAGLRQRSGHRLRLR